MPRCLGILLPLQLPQYSETHRNRNTANMIETWWDDQGRMYYHNSVTGITQWNKPHGYQVPRRVSRTPDALRNHRANFSVSTDNREATVGWLF